MMLVRLQYSIFVKCKTLELINVSKTNLQCLTFKNVQNFRENILVNTIHLLV